MSARSISAAVTARVMGDRCEAIALGHGHLLLPGGYVVSLTPVGGARLPNGVECDLHPARGRRIALGEGRIGAIDVMGAELWDPVPRPRVTLATGARMSDPTALAGRGPGLTPAGDDILSGYVAGLYLFHQMADLAEAIARHAATRTTALSATLLLHAARGELPEPAHLLLERGEVAPLLAWGSSSGRCLALGLAMAFRPWPRSAAVLDEKEVGSAHTLVA